MRRLKNGYFLFAYSLNLEVRSIRFLSSNIVIKSKLDCYWYYLVNAKGFCFEKLSDFIFSILLRN